jgi:hypothetical protein
VRRSRGAGRVGILRFFIFYFLKIFN